jgi:hypothetical protein
MAGSGQGGAQVQAQESIWAEAENKAELANHGGVWQQARAHASIPAGHELEYVPGWTLLRERHARLAEVYLCTRQRWCTRRLWEHQKAASPHAIPTPRWGGGHSRCADPSLDDGGVEYDERTSMLIMITVGSR